MKYGGIFYKQGEKGAQGPPGNMGPQGRPVSTYHCYYNLNINNFLMLYITNSAFCYIHKNESFFRVCEDIRAQQESQEDRDSWGLQEEQ